MLDPNCESNSRHLNVAATILNVIVGNYINKKMDETNFLCKTKSLIQCTYAQNAMLFIWHSFIARNFKWIIIIGVGNKYNKINQNKNKKWNLITKISTFVFKYIQRTCSQTNTERKEIK